MRALGEAHLKCCMQRYHALALITKGSVRTLIRSVEETNGAGAWRLIHSRYAPDTQNRQCALMQKIMMPAKPWCDHTEGFELGLRSWELDDGEWERASGPALADAVKYTVMMNMAPIFLRNCLQLGRYAQQHSSCLCETRTVHTVILTSHTTTTSSLTVGQHAKGGRFLA